MNAIKKGQKPKRVLHVIRSLKMGGIGAFIMNMYRKIDTNKIQFDFAVAENDYGDFGKEILECGGKIYFISSNGNKHFTDGIIQLINLNKLLKNNKYLAIHCHYYFANAYFLLIAKLRNVPIRVSHCHNTRVQDVNFLRKIFEKISLRILEKTSTNMLGCSDAATIFLYGKKNFDINKAMTVYNGIDYEIWNKERFIKNDIIRKYSIESGINFVFVGRFENQKNPIFLIDVFYELSKMIEKVNLTLIGYGGLEKAVKEEVEKKNLSLKVHFLPHNTNVTEILSAMDYALLPSLYEGLPISLIEMQAMDVICFISSNISQEIDMGLSYFIDIDKGAKFYANEINKIIEELKVNSKKGIVQRKQIFDVDNMLRTMISIYNN